VPRKSQQPDRAAAGKGHIDGFLRQLPQASQSLDYLRHMSQHWVLNGITRDRRGVLKSLVAGCCAAGARASAQERVAQTSCFSKSAAFLRGFTDKPQSLEKRETLRYLLDLNSI
jgi:hypothetical protein